MKTTSAAPDFTHAPGYAGRYSMLAYGGGQGIEYFIPGKSFEAAKYAANYFARQSFCQRFVLRDPQGKIVFDGEVK